MHRSKIITYPLLIAASLLAGAAFTIASAADADAGLQRTVTFGDLDLSRPQGAQAVYARVRAAAKQVCAPLDGATVTQKYRLRSCMKTAIANAVAGIDQPAVTQVFMARLGRHPEARRLATIE